MTRTSIEYIRDGRRKRLVVHIEDGALAVGPADPAVLAKLTFVLRLEDGRPMSQRHIEEMEEDLGPVDEGRDA